MRITNRGAAAIVGTALAVFTLGPAPASAGPLQRITEAVTSVSCVFDTEEGAAVVLEASSNNRFGAEALVLVEESSGDITTVGFTETDPWSGSGFDLRVPLVTVPDEQPAGEASFAATFSPSSATHVEPVRHRDGNAWTTGTVSFTELAFDFSSVSVLGYTVLPETARCNGDLTVLDFRQTNPAASVSRTIDLESEGCDVEGIPGAMVQLSGDLRAVRVTLMLGEGLRGIGVVDMRGRTGTGTFDVVDSAGATVTRTTVTLSLDEAGPAELESFREHGLFYRAQATPYTADVTVTTADGRSGSSTCAAWYVVQRLIDTPPGGSSGH